MSSETMTNQGQITVPADVLKELGLDAGVQVEFVRGEQGEYRIRPKRGTIRDLKGSLPRPKKPVSLEQMDAAIASTAARAGQ